MPHIAEDRAAEILKVVKVGSADSTNVFIVVTLRSAAVLNVTESKLLFDQVGSNRKGAERENVFVTIIAQQYLSVLYFKEPGRDNCVNFGRHGVLPPTLLP